MNHPGQRSKPLLLTCFAFFCLSSHALFAQQENAKVERFTTENGLSSNVVYCSFQDKHGFLWIGTNDGLNRYDGYTFTTYRLDPNDSCSIPSNAVYTICEDGDGKLWIGTNAGQCYFDNEKNNFRRVKFTGVRFPLNKEELLLYHSNRLEKLNIHSLTTTRITTPEQATDFHIGIPYKSADHNVYMTASREDSILVLKLEPGKNAFTVYLSFTRGVELPGTGNVFFVDSRNYNWLGTSQKKSLLFSTPSDSTDPASKKWRSAGPFSAVNHILEDKKGFLWISTTETLIRYDPGSGQFIELPYNSSNGMKTTSLTNSVYQDRTGLIWISSYNGLFKMNPGVSAFKGLTKDKGQLPLKDNFILGLFHSTGNKAWINYQWGIPHHSLLDLENNTIQHFSGPVSKKYIVEAWLQDGDPLDEKRIDEWYQKNFPFGVLPQKLFFDRKKDLWHLTAYDLWIHPEKKVVNSVHMLMDAYRIKDEIWIATEGNGLQVVNMVTATSTYYRFEKGKNSVSSNDLTCLLSEENGNTWIGTRGGGLDYFDRQKNTFLHYSTRDGLTNNSVFCLTKDLKGRLWIGTANGISCFDTVSKTFRNFSRADGLLNSEYNRYSACLLPNGYILMGGMDGIDYFHPDNVLAPAYRPTILITGIKVMNRSVFPFRDLRLKHNQNYLTIDYAAMDFRNPSHHKYEYKMEGINQDWVPAGTQHSVSYASLAPGRYQFLVRSINSDGTRSENAAIDLFIITPWWKTAWFYGACIMLILALLFFFYKYRIRQLKKLMQLRTKISQDLHDDVGATLSGIRLFSQLAQERPVHRDKYLNKITHYSDDMLNKLSDIVWSINADNDRFDHLVSKLRNYAQAMTAAKNITLTFNVDPGLIKKDLEITLKKNIYMITREAINNTIKYADCNQLEIGIFQSNGGAELIIRDNGHGFDENKITQGNGMINMRKRAEQVNGKLSISSAPGSGTVIRLNFKFT